MALKYTMGIYLTSFFLSRPSSSSFQKIVAYRRTRAKAAALAARGAVSCMCVIIWEIRPIRLEKLRGAGKLRMCEKAASRMRWKNPCLLIGGCFLNHHTNRHTLNGRFVYAGMPPFCTHLSSACKTVLLSVVVVVDSHHHDDAFNANRK